MFGKLANLPGTISLPNSLWWTPPGGVCAHLRVFTAMRAHQVQRPMSMVSMCLRGIVCRVIAAQHATACTFLLSTAPLPVSCLCRPSRAQGVSCKATAQLEVPKTVTAPRQVPAKSVALQPVVQEATAHYGKPLRGSPTTLGATYIKDAVRAVQHRRQALYVSAYLTFQQIQ